VREMYLTITPDDPHAVTAKAAPTSASRE